MYLSMQSWNWWEKLVQQYSQTSFSSGSAQFGRSRLHVVEGCRVDCDRRARVVQRLVCAIKWMMWSTMTRRSNCLLTPCHKTHPVVNYVVAHWGHTDKNETLRAGMPVRLCVPSRWNCAVVVGMLFTHPVGHWKIAIFGDGTLLRIKELNLLDDYVSRHLS